MRKGGNNHQGENNCEENIFHNRYVKIQCHRLNRRYAKIKRLKMIREFGDIVFLAAL